MLDFNHKSTLQNNISDQLNKLIDSALTAKRKTQEGRSYLGASRIGVNCSRLLQYEYLNVEKDADKEFKGQVLRIFAAGHVFEELAIKWLREAGFNLLTQNTDLQQIGFSAAGGKIKGHVDGIIISAPSGIDMQGPALWEMKSMNSKNWQATVKKSLTIHNPVYAAQIALYQAYMEESFPGISRHPALFTAINRDTSELYHELVSFDAELAQRMSDKAVNIIKACDAGELLPRINNDRNFFECKYCAYQDRCWNQNVADIGGNI